MEEELMSAKEFFGDFDKRAPLVHVPVGKTSDRERSAFEKVKVKMVMKIERCSRKEALRIIAERSADRRPGENARRDDNDRDFRMK